MAVIGAELSTDKFDWNPKTQYFTAWASDLPFVYSGRRIWDDACDEGFVLVSAKTGRKIPVALKLEQRDEDNDIVAWYFKSVNPDIPFFVTIFND